MTRDAEINAGPWGGVWVVDQTQRLGARAFTVRGVDGGDRDQVGVEGG